MGASAFLFAVGPWVSAVRRNRAGRGIQDAYLLLRGCQGAWHWRSRADAALVGVQRILQGHLARFHGATMPSSSLEGAFKRKGFAPAESVSGTVFEGVAMSEALAESGDRRQGKSVKIA
jgi:hypothetical protein